MIVDSTQDYRELRLAKGEICLADSDHYKWLIYFHWVLNKRGYVWTNVQRLGEKQRSYLLSRMVMGVPVGSSLKVDHKNGNTLGNRKSNLRVCTHRENLRNRRKQNCPTNSRYKGVDFVKRIRMPSFWVARIRLETGLTYLGRFPDEESAARAYDEAAKLHFGEFANLNFKE